jgi:hypothetical protein
LCREGDEEGGTMMVQGTYEQMVSRGVTKEYARHLVTERNREYAKARQAVQRDGLMLSALCLAMVRAGFGDAKIWIHWHQDSTDSYADYSGYLVTADSAEVAERAAKWLCAWDRKVSPKAERGSCYLPEMRHTCGQRSDVWAGKVDGTWQAFACMFRYSLGD